jgi:hypothetical protein
MMRRLEVDGSAAVRRGEKAEENVSREMTREIEGEKERERER